MTNFLIYRNCRKSFFSLSTLLEKDHDLRNHSVILKQDWCFMIVWKKFRHLSIWWKIKSVTKKEKLMQHFFVFTLFARYWIIQLRKIHTYKHYFSQMYRLLPRTYPVSLIHISVSCVTYNSYVFPKKVLDQKSNQSFLNYRVFRLKLVKMKIAFALRPYNSKCHFLVKPN